MSTLISVVAVAAALLAGGLVVVVGPAGAHTDLVQGSPGPGQRVGGEVDFVDLVYAAPVTEVVVAVRGPDGEAQPGRMVVADGQIIRHEMEPLTEPGRYLVEYEMISDDGDFTIGSFFFDFDPAAVAPTRLGQLDLPDDSPFTVRNIVGGGAAIVLVAVCSLLAVRLRRTQAKLEDRRSERAS